MQYTSDEPLHAQIRELIRRQAIAGEIVDADGRLMTEAELISHFGVSRVTIRNAIAPLVAEGLFDRTRGKGTFLRNNSSERWVGRLLGYQELLEEAGFQPGAKITHQGMVECPDVSVQQALGERVVWQLRRVRYADDNPVAIEHAFYPPDVGLKLQQKDLTTIRMYEVFELDFGITIKEGTQTIGACISSEVEKNDLRLQKPTALVSMERVTIADDGRAVEFLRSVYQPEKFQFTINLTRGNSSQSNTRG